MWTLTIAMGTRAARGARAAGASRGWGRQLCSDQRRWRPSCVRQCVMRCVTCGDNNAPHGPARAVGAAHGQMRAVLRRPLTAICPQRPIEHCRPPTVPHHVVGSPRRLTTRRRRGTDPRQPLGARHRRITTAEAVVVVVVVVRVGREAGRHRGRTSGWRGPRRAKRAPGMRWTWRDEPSTLATPFFGQLLVKRPRRRLARQR